MTYEVAQDNTGNGTWRVEAINFEGDGEVYVTIFAGTESESRARQYADWMNSRQYAKAS